jgi:trehalose/maltose transport system permease protein
MRQAGKVLAAIAVAAWSLAPFLWQIVTSVKPDAELARLPPMLPVEPTLEHYRAVFTGAPFLRIIANSALVATCATLLSLSIGSLAAFGLAKLRVRSRGLILLFVLSASMFPPIATVSPLYLIIRALGLRDTVWALILTHTVLTLPLSIWVLTNFFRGIPDEIYRASLVDGCTPFQSLIRVILPLASPGIVTTGILAFIFSWNEFLFALTFTATDASRTIPVAIALFPGLHEVPWGDIAAASVVVTLPLVALVFLFQKRIIEGLTAGAMKG